MFPLVSAVTFRANLKCSRAPTLYSTRLSSARLISTSTSALAAPGDRPGRSGRANRSNWSEKRNDSSRSGDFQRGKFDKRPVRDGGSDQRSRDRNVASSSSAPRREVRDADLADVPADDAELTKWVKKQKQGELEKRKPLYERSNQPTHQSYLQRLLSQIESEKRENMTSGAKRTADMKEARKLAASQAYGQKPAPAAATSAAPKKMEFLGESTEDLNVVSNSEVDGPDYEEDINQESSEAAQMAMVEEGKRQGRISSRLQVMHRRGRLRFYASISPDQKAKIVQALHHAKVAEQDPRKSLLTTEQMEEIFKSKWATKAGKAPKLSADLPEFAKFFKKWQSIVQKRVDANEPDPTGLISLDVEEVPETLFKNKILLLQAFECAVVGKTVQPINLNLHMQGKMALELKLAQYYTTKWKRLPQGAISSLIKQDTSVAVLGSVALALGLAPFVHMTPNVPLDRFKEADRVRMRMLSSALLSLFGLIYREHGMEAFSLLVDKYIGDKLLLSEVDLSAHYYIVPGQALDVLKSICRSFRLPQPIFASLSSEPGQAIEGIWAGERFLGKGIGKNTQAAQHDAALRAVYHFFSLKNKSSSDQSLEESIETPEAAAAAAVAESAAGPEADAGVEVAEADADAEAEELEMPKKTTKKRVKKTTSTAAKVKKVVKKSSSKKKTASATVNEDDE